MSDQQPLDKLGAASARTGPGTPLSDRPLNGDEVDLAFALILGRQPKPEMRESLVKEKISASQLRHRLLGSSEFAALYDTLRPAPRLPGSDHSTQRPALIHIHVPKTAGRSLNVALRKQCKGDEHVTATGAPPEIKLREMPAQARAKIGLVAGHCSYGVHRFLDIPARYLFVLRKPGPRILSYYKYVLRDADHPMHAKVNEERLDFGGFLDLCTKVPGLHKEMHNGQMRRIAGNMGDSGFGQEEALFDAACAHLIEPGAIFGFTEQFNAFVDRLAAENILPDNSIRRVNTAPPGPGFEQARDTLNAHQAALLDEFIEWDDKLLDFARTVDTPNRAE